MKVKDLLIMSLQNAMTDSKIDVSSVDFYVFGSSSLEVVKNDLDLLIVYDKNGVSVAELISLKSHIYRNIELNLNCVTDFMTFNYTEAKQYKIVKRVKASRINL